MTVGLYTLVLYSTLTIAFDLYVSIFDQIGREAMSTWMNRFFFAVGILLFFLVFLVLPRRKESYLAFSLLVLGVAFSLHLLSIPAKRFHFFQYAPLTYLVYEAIGFRIQGSNRYLWSFTLVTILGLGDESLQWLLPDRHFGLADVVLNAVAGLFTLVFIGYVLGEENYPWPRTKKATPKGSGPIA